MEDLDTLDKMMHYLPAVLSVFGFVLNCNMCGIEGLPFWFLLLNFL